MTRKLTPKELQVRKPAKWDVSSTYSTSSSTPHHIPEKFAEAIEHTKRSLVQQQMQAFRAAVLSGFKEKEYQEPERDEQGTLYGYKVLLFQHNQIRSPQYPMRWTPDGRGLADTVPTQTNTNGIYFTKRDSDEQIHWYYSRYRNTGFVVKCALFGKSVIETETGFRAHMAQIVAVHDTEKWITFEEMMNYGNRKNDQDSYKHTRGYSGGDTEETPYYTPWRED